MFIHVREARVRRALRERAVSHVDFQRRDRYAVVFHHDHFHAVGEHLAAHHLGQLSAGLRRQQLRRGRGDGHREQGGGEEVPEGRPGAEGCGHATSEEEGAGGITRTMAYEPAAGNLSV